MTAATNQENEARDAAFEQWFADRFAGNLDARVSTADGLAQYWARLAWQAATEMERERCAKIAEKIRPDNYLEEHSWDRGHWEEVARNIATVIRAEKGETK